MKNAILLVLSCFAGAAAIGACGSSSTTGGSTSTGGSTGSSTTSTSTSTSSGTIASTSSSSGTTGSSSSGASNLVNGCDPSTTTVSAGNVTITFPTGALPAQYTPACVKVHAGAMVTWNGAFASHPLTPDGTGNPITATSTGTTVSFTFPDAGDFGFHCALHPTIMLGAVFVVP